MTFRLTVVGDDIETYGEITLRTGVQPMGGKGTLVNADSHVIGSEEEIRPRIDPVTIYTSSWIDNSLPIVYSIGYLTSNGTIENYFTYKSTSTLVNQIRFPPSTTAVFVDAINGMSMRKRMVQPLFIAANLNENQMLSLCDTQLKSIRQIVLFQVNRAMLDL